MTSFVTPLQLAPSPVTRYKWQNHSRNPCSECERLDGQIRDSYQWINVYTHKHCKCSLEPIEEAETAQGTGNNFNIVTYYNLDNSWSYKPKAPTCPVILPPNPATVNPHDFM